MYYTLFRFSLDQHTNSVCQKFQIFLQKNCIFLSNIYKVNECQLISFPNLQTMTICPSSLPFRSSLLSTRTFEIPIKLIAQCSSNSRSMSIFIFQFFFTPLMNAQLDPSLPNSTIIFTRHPSTHTRQIFLLLRLSHLKVCVNIFVGKLNYI